MFKLQNPKCGVLIQLLNKKLTQLKPTWIILKKIKNRHHLVLGMKEMIDMRDAMNRANPLSTTVR